MSSSIRSSEAAGISPTRSGADHRRRGRSNRSATRQEPGAIPSPTSLGDESWSTVFQDQQLQELIRTAFQQNYDVKIAATRILEAQAQLGITRADQFPTLSGDAAASKQRTARSSFLPAFETSVLQVDLMLAWELDFWGQFRRATESAQASLLASAWGQRAVISTSVSNVAMAYFQLRALDLELKISTHTLASRQASLRLNRFLVDHGATTLLDVRQAEQLVYTCAPQKFHPHSSGHRVSQQRQ